MECIAACTQIQPIADPVVDGLGWFADLHLPCPVGRLKIE